MIRLLLILIILIINVICYPSRGVPSTHPYHNSDSNQHYLAYDCPSCSGITQCSAGLTETQAKKWSAHINKYGNAYCYNNDDNWLHVNSNENLSNYWFYANSFEIENGSNIYMNGPEIVEVKKLDKSGTYNIYFGGYNSKYPNKTFKSFYLTNRDEIESKIDINGHPYYKVDQCKQESDSRPDNNKISCVAIYDPPANDSRTITLNSNYSSGRFIMDYSDKSDKNTPKFTSFSGITEVEFRGPKEYDFCSVYNGNAKSVYLADGIKLNMNLCDNQKDIEYTFNLMGSSAELKFNQNTTINLAIGNKDSTISFKSLSSKYKLNIKDITISTYQLTLDLSGNYDYSFSSVKLTNGGKLKLLNSSTISLSNIYQGNNLLMNEVSISANSMIINSPSDKAITIEGTNINISSQCTNILTNLTINNQDNSQATVNLTNCLTLSTIYKGLKLEILRNDSINNFNYHDPIEVNKIEVDTGMIKFIRETTSPCAIKLINAIGKTSINYENYSGLQITELNFSDSLSFIGSEEKIVYIKGLNYKISTKTNIFNNLYIKVSTEIKLYPDSNSNTDTLHLCVPNDKDSISEMDWTSSIIKKYTIDPFTGQNNTHTLTLKNNSNTLFTSEYGQNIKAIYEIENSSLSWEAIGDIEEVNIKSIESSNINTIKFLDENTKKNIIVENILCDTSLDITQMEYVESQLNINNIQVGTESLKLLIKDNLENNVIIDKIIPSRQLETFSINIDGPQTKYRKEEMNFNIIDYFLFFKLNYKEAKNETKINFIPINNTILSISVEDFNESLKTKFPLYLNFVDQNKQIINGISIDIATTVKSSLIKTIEYTIMEKYIKADLSNEDIQLSMNINNNDDNVYVKDISAINSNAEKEVEIIISESGINEINEMTVTKIKKLSFKSDKEEEAIHMGVLKINNTNFTEISSDSNIDFDIVEEINK